MASENLTEKAISWAFMVGYIYKDRATRRSHSEEDPAMTWVAPSVVTRGGVHGG